MAGKCTSKGNKKLLSGPLIFSLCNSLQQSQGNLHPAPTNWKNIFIAKHKSIQEPD